MKLFADVYRHQVFLQLHLNQFDGITETVCYIGLISTFCIQIQVFLLHTKLDDGVAIFTLYIRTLLSLRLHICKHIYPFGVKC